MDIYAKIKYNKPQELLPVVNAALRPVAMSWKYPFLTMFSVNIRAKSSCDILKSVGISRGIGIFSAQYGLKAARRAPQFSKRWSKLQNAQKPWKLNGFRGFSYT